MAKLRILNPGTHKIKIVKLVHTYSKLGLKESKDKVDYFPSEFEIDKEYADLERIVRDFTIAGAIVQYVESADLSSHETESPNPFLSVKLINPGYNKIEIIKLIRTYSNYSLKESKELIDTLPSIIKFDKAVPDFEILRKIFEDAGATIERDSEEQSLGNNEKVLFKRAKLKVNIVSAGQHIEEVVKLIKLFSGLSLNDSKKILDQSPALFDIENPEISLEQIRKNFEAIGAIVQEFEEVRTSEINRFEEKIDVKLSSKPHEASDNKN